MVADDTPSAAHRVFNITELLERILLQVIWDDYDEDDLDKPLQTVLLSQRVSKTFNATITGSTAILRSLWLLQPFDDNRTVDNDGFNPLLVNKCGGLKFTETNDYATSLAFSRSSWRWRSRYFIEFHPRVSGVQKPEESDASWKRMHIVSSDKMLRGMRVGVFVDEDCTSAGRSGYFGDVKLQFDDAASPSLIELTKKAWDFVTGK